MSAPKTMNLPTIDDFEPEGWDALCYARKYRMQGDWYRLLRALTSYRSPSSPVNKHLQNLVDRWLAEHPSWMGKHYCTERLLYDRMRRTMEAHRARRDATNQFRRVR